MKKRISLLLLSVILIFCTSIQTCAVSPDRKEHDDNLLFVLFEKGKYDLSKKDKVKMLEYASYLAIDQFNYTKRINKNGEDVGNGAKELAYLKNKKVKNLPEEIEDIDFKASGNTHRFFTHRGWDFEYQKTTESKGHWKQRKKILCSTTSKVFGLKNTPDSTCDDFSALIYYVHIITDHTQDKWDNDRKKISNQGRKMPLAVAHPGEDNKDIFLELENIINNLFETQKDSKDFKKLSKELSKLAKKTRKLVAKKGGINSAERFEKHHDYAEKTLKALEDYVPVLLKNEEFFRKVF